MGIAFQVAAKAAEASEDEDVVDVPIDDVVYKARRPTAAQSVLLNMSLAGQGTERLTSVFELVESLLGPDALKHIKRLIMDRRIDFGDLVGGSDQNPDGGLIDMVFAEFAARPTEPSTASSNSQPAGGRKSTRRAPGKGSTRSASPSTGS